MEGLVKCDIFSILLSHRRSKYSLPPPVQFGHDDVLCLVGAGLGREVDHIGKIALSVNPVHQLVLHVGGLASASVPHKHDWTTVLDHQVHQVGVSHSVNSGHYEVGETLGSFTK